MNDYAPPVPQADNPGLIMAVVRRIGLFGFNIDDLAQNALPEYSRRQVHYYADAAFSLGLLNDDWTLSEIGKEFCALAGNEAIAFFVDRVEQFLDEDEICGNISGTTLVRRQKTIDAWEHFVSLSFEYQVRLCESSEWRRRKQYKITEPTNVIVVDKKICNDCFMPIPSGCKECPECLS